MVKSNVPEVGKVEKAMGLQEVGVTVKSYISTLSKGLFERSMGGPVPLLRLALSFGEYQQGCCLRAKHRISSPLILPSCPPLCGTVILFSVSSVPGPGWFPAPMPDWSWGRHMASLSLLPSLAPGSRGEPPSQARCADARLSRLLQKLGHPGRPPLPTLFPLA